MLPSAFQTTLQVLGADDPIRWALGPLAKRAGQCILSRISKAYVGSPGSFQVLIPASAARTAGAGPENPSNGLQAPEAPSWVPPARPGAAVKILVRIRAAWQALSPLGHPSTLG